MRYTRFFGADESDSLIHMKMLPKYLFALVTQLESKLSYPRPVQLKRL